MNRLMEDKEEFEKKLSKLDELLNEPYQYEYYSDGNEQYDSNEEDKEAEKFRGLDFQQKEKLAFYTDEEH